MNRISMRAVGVRALVAGTAVAMFATLGPATITYAAPVDGVSTPVDDVAWKTSAEDRVKAFGVVGADADADPALLTMSDRDFVLEIWKRARPAPAGVGLSEVHAAAEIALMAGDQDGYVAFIISGIHDAKRADIDNQLVAEQAARQARELRRTAAAHAKIDVTDHNLLLSERDFIFEVMTKAPGRQVRGAAESALRGTAAQQHEFLVTGVLKAAEQDVQDELAAIEAAQTAKREKLQRDQARRTALAWLGKVATDGQLEMTDEAFLHVVWNEAESQDHEEIIAAVVKALRTQDAATMRTCIDTGIAVAARDKIKRELAAKAAADKKAAEQIRDQAESKYKRNLAMAAAHALANGPDAIDEFIRIGQYQVAPDTANHPGTGSWQWRNVASGRCLGIEGDSTDNGAKVVLRACTDRRSARHDQWFAMRVEGTNSQYRLVYSRDTTKCLTLPDGAGNGQLILSTCNGPGRQKWYFTKEGATYRWATTEGNRVIGVAGAGKADKTPVVAVDVNAPAADRVWRPSQDTLLPGTKLKVGKSLESADGRTMLVNQSDGNLVLYDTATKKALWHTKTWQVGPSTLANQLDGNQVLYSDKTDKPVWDSSTYKAGPSTLILQNDANLVLYQNKDDKPIWHSDTWRR